jgi:glycosyltransferase involved in cell wall biosynthesis
MVTVVIPTLNDERVLVPALAALVPGSAAGLIREVILADGGSTDDTEKVADVAGCDFRKGPHDLGARLRSAANSARSQWLLFLHPAGMLEEDWTREVRIFTEKAERLGLTEKRAATFRLGFEGFGLKPKLAQAAAATRHILSGRPRADQGLLISKRLYQMLGGHKDGARAEQKLISRVGRRIVTLRASVVIGDAS